MLCHSYSLYSREVVVSEQLRNRQTHDTPFFLLCWTVCICAHSTLYRKKHGPRCAGFYWINMSEIFRARPVSVWNRSHIQEHPTLSHFPASKTLLQSKLISLAPGNSENCVIQPFRPVLKQMPINSNKIRCTLVNSGSTMAKWMISYVKWTSSCLCTYCRKHILQKSTNVPMSRDLRLRTEEKDKLWRTLSSRRNFTPPCWLIHFSSSSFLLAAGKGGHTLPLSWLSKGLLSFSSHVITKCQTLIMKAFYNHPQTACADEHLAAKTELIITSQISPGEQAINKQVFQGITLTMWGTSFLFFSSFLLKFIILGTQIIQIFFCGPLKSKLTRFYCTPVLKQD